MSHESVNITGATIAHIGVAVARIDDALPFYRQVLGIDPGPPEAADGARIVSLPFGGTEVELLEPLTPDGPIARFLARRGPGIHCDTGVASFARALSRASGTARSPR